MAERSKVWAELYNQAREWEEGGRLDIRDHFPFQGLLDELLFHSELRFSDYIQFASEGEFGVRLKKWLCNVPEGRQRKVLLSLLRYLTFVDRLQMVSLYRDAFRRIVVPFVRKDMLSADDLLSGDYGKRVLSVLRQYRLFSITESFQNPGFINANDLAGLSKSDILGEDVRRVPMMLPKKESSIIGVIVFEDFVGSGKQARNVLVAVKQYVPSHWRILFVPLIILERGLKLLREESELKSVAVEPALIVSEGQCIKGEFATGEPEEYSSFRALVKSTADRVLQRLDDTDDPPSDAFGYKGSGALIVTSHNTPNNTLPLIHHRAPHWVPLFRRVHHSKDGL